MCRTTQFRDSSCWPIPRSTLWIIVSRSHFALNRRTWQLHWCEPGNDAPQNDASGHDASGHDAPRCDASGRHASRNDASRHDASWYDASSCSWSPWRSWRSWSPWSPRRSRRSRRVWCPRSPHGSKHGPRSPSQWDDVPGHASDATRNGSGRTGSSFDASRKHIKRLGSEKLYLCYDLVCLLERKREDFWQSVYFIYCGAPSFGRTLFGLHLR